MKMHCKNCGIKFYPSDKNYIGYPLGSYYNKAPAHMRQFHSRWCWENWTGKISPHTLYGCKVWEIMIQLMQLITNPYRKDNKYGTIKNE